MDKIRLAPGVFDKNAKVYEAKNMDTSLYHDTFDVFCDSIGKDDAAILELACGPGNVTKYLLNKRPGYKILGTDLSPAMLELAKTNNPGVEFQLMDMGDIKNMGKKFDGVLCGFGLPYLSKEESVQLIADAATILNNGGVLYLSTMEDDYNKSAMQTSPSGDKVFMYYHEADYLLQAFEANGFEMIAVERKTSTNEDVPAVVDLVLIGKKV